MNEESILKKLELEAFIRNMIRVFPTLDEKGRDKLRRELNKRISEEDHNHDGSREKGMFEDDSGSAEGI